MLDQGVTEIPVIDTYSVIFDSCYNGCIIHDQAIAHLNYILNMSQLQTLQDQDVTTRQPD